VIDRDRLLLHEIVKQSRMWAVNMWRAEKTIA